MKDLSKLMTLKFAEKVILAEAICSTAVFRCTDCPLWLKKECRCMHDNYENNLYLLNPAVKIKLKSMEV